MSEVTLTDNDLRTACRILWNYGQFKASRLACDDDDIHEYLVEAGMLAQDHEANTDTNPNAFQWLSDASLDALHNARIEPFIVVNGTLEPL